ncbi:dihydrolipoamide acetyltransferase precursorlike protein [Trypanosoma conorhini]|uniref:Dihydrolipoamide acetyltransferaselike protein n=1 Tax=Trypanosoma conorhini TaxID=83891 RepID=A0A3R7PBW9_9TRYP|nr:dihydrolipoamide acetyltransferase precursorlike protein [Trypanosoma conorhini]RNF21076.1 dihydrolipoamide acetyltransferase precursorlike protein [Trypanosoma conorhini]
MRRSFLFLVNFSPLFMPALSPSMETGVIVEWKKKVGDLVKENEVFCTVQTDKAVVDYTNTFEAGYLAKIFCHNGETVAVAKTIAVMVEDAADVAKADEYTPEGEEASAPAAETPAAAEAPAAASGGSSELPAGVNASPIFMPALSPSMETGVIVEWKKKVGDLVKENEVFCTVQTDKAVVDYTNTFEAGYLAKIFCHNGETVAVAKTIAVMVEDAADVPKLAGYCPEDAAAGGGPAKAAEAPAAAAAAAPPSGKRYGGSLEGAIAASGPAVMRIAARLDRKTLESLQFTGKGGRFLKSDFLGQPGFNDDEVPPPAASAAPAAPAAAATSGATQRKPAAAAQPSAGGGVVVRAIPVYNLKVSDTTLLQQLIRTMPPPKPKAAAAVKKQ